MCFISRSLMENYVSFPFKRCIRLIHSWINLSVLENLLTSHIKISSVKLYAGYNNQSFKMKKRYYWEVFSYSNAAENEMLIPKVKWGCYTRLNSSFTRRRWSSLSKVMELHLLTSAQAANLWAFPASPCLFRSAKSTCNCQQKGSGDQQYIKQGPRHMSAPS